MRQVGKFSSKPRNLRIFSATCGNNCLKIDLHFDVFQRNGKFMWWILNENKQILSYSLVCWGNPLIFRAKSNFIADIGRALKIKVFGNGDKNPIKDGARIQHGV
jgi:hypothetical protein